MSPDKPTICPDFELRFDGFLDGELDAHSLRAMALHAGSCPTCGAELERAERLQVLLSDAVEERIEAVDTSRLWASIEARLESQSPGFWARARSAASEALSPRTWLRPMPALALTGAIAAVLAIWMWPTAANAPASVEVANNHAQIERIESSSPHVAIWSEPGNHTTAIWVASYDPDGQ